MVLLKPLRQSTLALLDEPWHPQRHRPYLGMSEIGHSCLRYLWYSFRWAFTEEHSSRMIRLFARGHREEEVVIRELQKIGYNVLNRQLEFIAGFGHIKGHCDGEVEGVIEAPKTVHILEVKTMNDKNFRDVIKSGIKQSKPVYYAQAQLYMHYGERTRTLMVCVNKNDDSYYIERIEIDPDQVFKLRKRGKGVILLTLPPTRPFSKSWYECRYCSAKEICHYDLPMDANCRTCVYAAPTKEGEWNCKEVFPLSIIRQSEGCYEHHRIDN